MATAVDEINKQMMQPYSSEANVNQMADRVQTMRKRGAGRGARLTGSGSASKAPLATAAQLNPRAVKRGEVSASRAKGIKSLYQFAANTRGRFFKKNRSYADFLGLGRSNAKSVLENRKKQRGGKRSRSGRQAREAKKIQNMYNAYVKRFKSGTKSRIAQF